MMGKSLVAAFGAFLFGSLAALYAAGPPMGPDLIVALRIESKEIPLSAADPAADRVGHLAYRGGIELTSADRRFGGISAILWEPDCGRLLGVSDTGSWLILEPEEADGRLLGIAAAYLAPILGTAGTAPASKRDADAEALSRVGDETFVWFEQDHRAQSYSKLSACNPETLATVAGRVIRPPAMANWPANGGAEAVATAGARQWIVSEAMPGADKDSRVGLMLDADGGVVRQFSHRPPAGFQPTGMDTRDPGDPDSPMLLVYRRFSPLTGVAAVIAEVDFAALDHGQVQELARLQPPLAVDNMEGIAVRAEGDRRFIYLISDDNFNPLQRTLLLKFEILPDAR